MRTDANLKTPMFQAHGGNDNVVAYKFGHMTYITLKTMGIDIEFHKIDDIGHETEPEELNTLGEWLKEKVIVRETVNVSKVMDGNRGKSTEGESEEPKAKA